MTDDELLKRAGRGDEAAFLLLYERHREAVFRFAYRLSGSVDVAKDVTHECFVHLIEHTGAFDPARASLRTYLYAATRNLTVSRLRRDRTVVGMEELPAEPRASSEHDPLHVLLDEELSLAVQRAILNLPPLQREAVLLFEYEDLSLVEIAATVGADVGTIKARLHRARESLRRSLFSYLNDADHATWKDTRGRR